MYFLRLPSDEHIRSIEDGVRQAAKIMDLHQRQYIEEIGKALAAQEAVVVSFQAEIEKIIAPQRDYLEQCQRWEKQCVDEKEAFSATGWWMSPTILDQDSAVIEGAIEAFHAGDTMAIDRLFFDVFERDDHQLLRQMVSSWQKNPFFHSRDHLIQAAYRAHLQGEYFLSIPVLLLIVEGIAHDLIEKDPIVEQDGDSSSAVKTIKWIYGQTKKKGVDHKDAISYFLEALDRYLYKGVRPTEGQKGSPILNRHAILHGYTTSYGTVANSLRCFMMLDAISLFRERVYLKNEYL